MPHLIKPPTRTPAHTNIPIPSVGRRRGRETPPPAPEKDSSVRFDKRGLSDFKGPRDGAGTDAADGATAGFSAGGGAAEDR
jgi:hypothetical protein